MTQTLLPTMMMGSERVQKTAQESSLDSASAALGDEASGVSVRHKNIAVLISGSGSNLKALITAQQQGQLGAVRIIQVVSNRFKAGGLQHAANANIPAHLFSLSAFCEGAITPEKRSAYDAELAHTLNVFNPDLIVLAGWMHIFSPAFLSTVKAPVINLHPALPGQFAGAHGIDDAYAAWQAGKITQTGCMVHEVIEEIDAGKVIDTQIVPCLAGDSSDDLKQRMHVAEHELIVRAVRGYCESFSRVDSNSPLSHLHQRRN